MHYPLDSFYLYLINVYSHISQGMRNLFFIWFKWIFFICLFVYLTIWKGSAYISKNLTCVYYFSFFLSWTLITGMSPTDFPLYFFILVRWLPYLSIQISDAVYFIMVLLCICYKWNEKVSERVNTCDEYRKWLFI